MSCWPIYTSIQCWCYHSICILHCEWSFLCIYLHTDVIDLSVMHNQILKPKLTWNFNTILFANSANFFSNCSYSLFFFSFLFPLAVHIFTKWPVGFSRQVFSTPCTSLLLADKNLFPISSQCIMKGTISVILPKTSLLLYEVYLCFISP